MASIRGESRHVMLLLALLLVLLPLEQSIGGGSGCGVGAEHFTLTEWMTKYGSDKAALDKVKIWYNDNLQSMNSILKVKRVHIGGFELVLGGSRKDFLIFLAIYSLVMANPGNEAWGPANTLKLVQAHTHPASVLIKHCFSFGKPYQLDKFDHKNEYGNNTLEIDFKVSPRNYDSYIHAFQREFFFIFNRERGPRVSDNITKIECKVGDDTISYKSFIETVKKYLWDAYYDPNMPITDQSGVHSTGGLFVPREELPFLRLTLLLSIIPVYDDIMALYDNWRLRKYNDMVNDFKSYIECKEITDRIYDPAFHDPMGFFHIAKLPDYRNWALIAFLNWAGPIQDKDETIKRIESITLPLFKSIKWTPKHFSLGLLTVNGITFNMHYVQFVEQFLRYHSPGLIKQPVGTGIEILPTKLAVGFRRTLEDKTFSMVLFQELRRKFYLVAFMRIYRSHFIKAYDHHIDLMQKFETYVDDHKKDPVKKKAIGIAILKLAFLNVDYAKSCENLPMKGHQNVYHFMHFLEELNLFTGTTRSSTIGTSTIYESDLTDAIADDAEVRDTNLTIKIDDFTRQLISIPDELIPFLDQTIEKPGETREFAKVSALSFQCEVLVKHFMAKYYAYLGNLGLINNADFWYQRRTEFLLIFVPYIKQEPIQQSSQFSAISPQPLTNPVSQVPTLAIVKQSKGRDCGDLLSCVCGWTCGIGCGLLIITAVDYHTTKWIRYLIWPTTTTPSLMTGGTLISNTLQPPGTSIPLWIAVAIVLLMVGFFVYLFCCQPKQTANLNKQKKKNKKDEGGEGKRRSSKKGKQSQDASKTTSSFLTGSSTVPTSSAASSTIGSAVSCKDDPKKKGKPKSAQAKKNAPATSSTLTSSAASSSAAGSAASQEEEPRQKAKPKSAQTGAKVRRTPEKSDLGPPLTSVDVSSSTVYDSKKSSKKSSK